MNINMKKFDMIRDFLACISTSQNEFNIYDFVAYNEVQKGFVQSCSSMIMLVKMISGMLKMNIYLQNLNFFLVYNTSFTLCKEVKQLCRFS